MAIDAAAELDFLAAAAHRSIGDFRRLIESVPIEPGGRGTQLLEEFRATLTALDARVDAYKQDFGNAGDDVGREAVIRKMRRTNLEVLAFQSYTPWIHASVSSHLGLGLLYLIKGMVAALIQHSADVVVAPSTKYMYETYYKPLEPALARLGGTYPAGAPAIVVSYPTLEPDSLFLHEIVAHELGHSVIWENNLTTAILTAVTPATHGIINQAAAEYQAAHGSPPPVAAAEVSGILRNWIDEVVCDGVAVCLLGPSFLLTAAAFDTPFGGPRPSPTHPPFNVRTRFLLARLHSWGWEPLLNAEFPSAILEWIRSRAAAPQEAGSAAYFLTLERALDDLAGSIEATIANHLGSHQFQPSAYSDAEGEPAKELRELLKHTILPTQRRDGSHIDARAIILAGWLHALSDKADEPASLVEVVADRGYQRFLTKALEMSAVLERWAAVP